MLNEKEIVYKLLDDMEQIVKAPSTTDMEAKSKYVNAVLQIKSIKALVALFESVDKAKEEIINLKNQIAASTKEIIASNEKLSDSQDRLGRWMLWWTALMAISTCVLAWPSIKEFISKFPGHTT